MKILYFSSPAYADCDFPLVKSLMEKGHDVTYLILLAPGLCQCTLFNINRCHPQNDIILAAHYEELKVYENYFNLNKVFILNIGKEGNPHINSLQITWKLAKFILHEKFDVCHTDIQFVGFMPLLYLLKPWIVTMHDPFPHSEEATRRTIFYRNLAFHFCKYFVLLNKNQYKPFCDTYKIKPRNVTINRLGIYDNIHAFIKPEWKVRKNNVLFFGRITPYKGIEYLCDAFKKVHDAVPDATLTIAGGGKFYFDIDEYAQLSYIEIINHFITMEELAHLVYECAITVCPYIEATQSGVIMTSFSMCKPVVSTNVGGLGEMVDHGKSGLLVEPCNSDALAEAIIYLLSNRTIIESMNEYIRGEYYKGEKSWASIANKYLDFYELVK